MIEKEPTRKCWSYDDLKKALLFMDKNYPPSMDRFPSQIKLGSMMDKGLQLLDNTVKDGLEKACIIINDR